MEGVNITYKMNVESFVISIQNRQPIWNQQLSDHHNRYTLDKLWKEVGEENNCSVKEAQGKWKSLRDYYRKEVRKMQEERSGSGADSVYKSNWPYFWLLDFLRSQFKTRPTSGNTNKKRKINEDQSAATTVEEQPVSKEYLPDGNTDEMYEGNNSLNDLASNEDGGNVIEKSAECSTSVIVETVKEDLVHPNSFNKRSLKNDHLKKLVQIEEKKMAILEEKRSRTVQEKPDEDMLFFQSLLPHIKKIEGVDKLLFRNAVQSLVMKYAYEQTSNYPSRSTTSTSTHLSFLHAGETAQDMEENTSTPTPHESQDIVVLDLDEWNSFKFQK